MSEKGSGLRAVYMGRWQESEVDDNTLKRSVARWAVHLRVLFAVLIEEIDEQC